MTDQAKIINDLLDCLPPDARADEQVNQIVAAAVIAGAKALETVPQSPIRVQRVDEYTGHRTPPKTTWEVVDARLEKRDRVVFTAPTEQAARAWAAVHAPISGGAYIYAAVDTDEPWHDTDAEQMGNIHTYGVISGCTLAYDAANMTVDLAAGAIVHNTVPVNVTAATDAYTLVSDASNERWAALLVSSTGTAVLVSGDAAASSSVEPSKPEIGDRVLVGMAKIQAAQTIAANCEYQLDKRVITHATIRNTSEVTRAGSAGDMSLVITFPAAVTQAVRITGQYSRNATEAAAGYFGLKVNATTVCDAAASTALFATSATAQAENGIFVIELFPGATGYTGSIISRYSCFITSSGGVAVAPVLGPPALTAVMPAAAITSVTFRSGTASGLCTLGIKNVVVEII